MHDEIVARIFFADGVWREVYQQPNGKQYVVDDDCEPTFGVWYIPRCDDLPEPDAVVRAIEGQA